MRGGISIQLVIYFSFTLVGQHPIFPFITDTVAFEKVSEIALTEHSNNALYCDQTGYIWVGSEVGIFRYDGYQWLKFEQPINQQNEAIDPATNGIVEDQNGNFWRNSHKTGMVHFDVQNNILENIRPGDSTQLPIQNVISAKPYWWNSDTLIIKTMLGFFFYNVSAKSLSKPIIPYPDSANHFSAAGPTENYIGNATRGVAKHASNKNKIWLTTAKELLLFDISTNEFQYIPVPFRNEEINKSIAPLDVLSHGNEILITTWGAGIAVYNDVTKKWTNTLPTKPLTKDIGLYNVIHKLEKINDSLFIYAGSDHVGLYNHKNKKTSAFLIKDDYQMGHFTDVIVDHHGVLWALCHAGLFRSKHALFSGPEEATMKVTECYINNRLQKLDTGSGVNNFIVPIGGDITVRFAMVNPVNPEKYNYEYRLKGVDKNWRSIHPTQSISYNNTTAGNFIFEVRANEAGKEFSETKLANITFEVYFFQKLWFKILVLISIVTLAIWYYRNRILKIKSEERLKAQFESQIAKMEMQALRSQMNPHFIFNSLNSIKNYVVNKGPNEAADYLTKFSQLIRVILENSKSELLSLEQEIKALKLYIEIENKRFKEKFDFIIDIDSEIDLSATKIPPMIIQPYIENAIWHGLMHKQGQRKLLLQFLQLDNGILCIVEDNGIGRVASSQIGASTKNKNISLGTAITNDRIEAINKIHNNMVKTEIEDLMKDGIATGTRVKIFIKAINEID